MSHRRTPREQPEGGGRAAADQAALVGRDTFVRTVLAHLPLGIAVNRVSDGQVVYANDRFREIYALGSDPIEHVDTFYERAWRVDAERAEARRRVEAAIASGDSAQMRWERFRLVLDDGEERYVSAMNIPLLEEDLMISTVWDVTAEIRAQQEREALLLRVQEAQKAESLESLAGGLAHEFNNLLVGVLGNADFALLDVSDDDPVRELMLEIKASARRAAELVRQLLAYAGKERMLLDRVDVSALVRETTPLLRATVSQRAQLELALESDVPPVEGDATQLRQVLVNLVANAAEAVDDVRGRIDVATEVVEADADLLEAAALGDGAKPGTYVGICVSDTGIGMDEATRRRIFDPFFSSKFPGRGLGLAAVLGIVRSHGGAICVESEPGAGSSFRILLPSASDG